MHAVFIERCIKYSQLHQIKSNQILTIGLPFANSVTVNCSYRTFHTTCMGYWLV